MSDNRKVATETVTDGNMIDSKVFDENDTDGIVAERTKSKGTTVVVGSVTNKTVTNETVTDEI